MEKKLFDMMQWGRIEGVVYAEEDKPYEFLGVHEQDGGSLVQAYFPDARAVSVVTGKEETPMERVDESGFYAAYFTKKKLEAYHYRVAYDDGEIMAEDIYRFAPTISEEEMELFSKGIHYTVYQMLGAHPMTVDGVRGVRFAVWAPNAVRVSVVGDFNFWDGRRMPMHRHEKYGIFELFVPGLKPGDIYKYELKVKGGLTVLKADPYASAAEKRPNTASVVSDSSSFVWKDEEWQRQKKTEDSKEKPMSVYEMHLGSFKKPKEEDGSFYNYRELAVMTAEYVKQMGYTHIELLPVMEHPFDGSWGYQVTGYYAPTARYGKPEDFKFFVNYMHENGIGVILDWVPAHFPRDTFGLAAFDGTFLYEHKDPRQGSHPHWGTLIFNYGRPQVSNFLIANALYWAEEFHADGIRIDAVASMLYLDYGKKDGEWIANRYGGKENLEAIELFRHMNSIMKKRNPGVMMIAEESTAWPMVTGEVEDGGLGFDYKWNMGWMNDFTNYMKTDPIYRSGNQGALTFSIMYAYSENFMLVLSHDEVVHGKCSMINKMPGSYEQKFANLRAAYAYMMMHPGKKLLFMGQDFGQFSEWSEAKSLEWELTEEYEVHRKMQMYYKALNHFYKGNPALYEADYNTEGFEWIDCMDAQRSIITFLRCSKKKKQQLLVVCNFIPVTQTDYRVGVPFAGKFKEIFNSDAVEFGGEGSGNPRVKQSKPVNWNNRDNSIEITVPGLSVLVFSCEEEEPKKKAPVKRGTKAKEQEKPEAKAPAKTKRSGKPKAEEKEEAEELPETEVQPKEEAEELPETEVQPEEKEVKETEKHSGKAETEEVQPVAEKKPGTEAKPKAEAKKKPAPGKKSAKRGKKSTKKKTK